MYSIPFCGTVIDMRRLLSIVVLFLFLCLSVYEIEARVLPQARKSSGPVKRGATAGITISPKLRADRQALTIYFSNLQNASSVSYTLMYETNGQSEGAGGTISSLENTATRELLFGTCSKNVCRYHSNIKNAKLEVVSQLKSGKQSIKRYRIRV